MKKTKRLCAVLALAFMLLPQGARGSALKLSSPDGNLQLRFQVRKGRAYYSLHRGHQLLVRPSVLGMELRDEDWSNQLQMGKVSWASVDSLWVQPWGEEDTLRCHYNDLTVRLRRKGSARRLQLQFRLFNNGLGFRYLIDGKLPSDSLVLTNELTQFSMARNAMAWSIPAHPQNFYEHMFTASRLSDKDTVSTPLTLMVDSITYMAIHEAALTDYAKMNLVATDSLLTADLIPWSDGTKVKACGRLLSPWRMLLVERSAGALVTNRVMLNLNEPSRIANTSWIQPGKYIGIWWSIHKKKLTWELGPNHGATTERVKRYIDFAARHGFAGVLSEGWNPGWGKGERITFLKSYPDFDMDEVTNYARSKGVRWIAHTETWGNARLLEQEMESAFARFEALGINTVKTGYVGKLLDGREQPGSQYGIRHYRRVLDCAARHHLMIDNHEPAMPTGLQRTMPNLMTQEAVRGQEYNAWDPAGGNPPSHTAILPFTRGLAGPMDYTPAIFNYSEVVPDTHPHATLSKQLAEFVVLYSPLQMAADEIENYEYHPALAFIEACPTDWSKTIVPQGEIGEYIVTCRRAKQNDSWFVGALTNEKERSIALPLSFLDAGASYEAIIYEDGTDADYEHNPQSMHVRVVKVNRSTVLQLHLARSGGAAIMLKKQG